MSPVQFGFTANQLIKEGRVCEEEVALLKGWLTKQTFPKLSDEQVALFLISCSGELEGAQATIRAYFSTKREAPEVFDNRQIDRQELQKHLKGIEYCLLPERTDDGSALIFVRLRDTNYANFDLAPAMKLLFMTLDAALHDNPPNRLVIIYDMAGFGAMHLTRLRLGLAKTYFQYLQEALPIKVKNVHVLNTVSFVDKLMMFISPFIKKAVLERLIFHPKNMDLTVFHEKWIPKRCLPEDLGGDLPPANVFHEKTTKILAQMQPYFHAEELQRRSII